MISYRGSLCAIVADLPAEWAGVVPTEVFLAEARRIAAKAKQAGLTLRLMGGVAIRLHCLDRMDLAERLGRYAVGQQEFTDLDFMSYRRQRDRMKDFFEQLAYVKRRATLSSAASERQIYFHPKGWFIVDVFFDKLRVANHPLSFEGRLELDFPTISVTDLLLEKVQIVHMGEKDFKDAVLLVASHEISDSTQVEAIDSRYVARLLSNDWGMWYTVKSNLKGISEALDQLASLSGQERTQIGDRISTLLDIIEREPKSASWKLRSKIGTRKRWYQPVETTETVGEFGIWRLLERNVKKN